MARKLKLVGRDHVVTTKVLSLRARQIMAFQHPEGGEGLMMVSEDGLIYLRRDDGWVPFDMTPVDTMGASLNEGV